MDIREEILKAINSALKDVFNVDITKDFSFLLTKFENPQKTETKPGITFPSFHLAKYVKPKEEAKPEEEPKESKEPKEKTKKKDKKKKDKKGGNFHQHCLHIVQSIYPVVQNYLKESKCVEEVTCTAAYLNFFFTGEYLAKIIPIIINGKIGEGIAEKNEHVMIEYSQPNTHKTFHVGHMRNASLGMALVKMFEFNKYKVTAANYIGDIGTHIAKCLWYYLYFYEKKSDNIEENVPEGVPKVEFLGDLYSKACIELDFTRWTSMVLPGIITAKVTKIEDHPNEPKWKVCHVFDGKEEHQVVCGGKDYKEGDIVAYAPIGSRKDGKTVGVVDKKGVQSYGIMLSEKECGLSENRQKIQVFPPDTPIGEELTEIGRYPNIELDKNIRISDEMKKRDAQVKEILRKMEDKDEEITKLWKITRDWSIQDFKAIYEWTDCRFDHYFHESDVGDESKEMVIDAYNKGILTKSEGTIGIDLGKQLGWCMLLTSAGTGLYATKDLALARRKFEQFKVDRSIYVVDDSQSLHFKQVFATLERLGFEQAKKCYHLSYGLVVLPDGKMSSRKGTVITFSQLKEQLLKCIYDDYLNKYKGVWDDAEIENAARCIAVSVIKYGMLKQDTSTNIIFDLKEWTAKTGNTGPYLMYAYARTRSILREVPMTSEERSQANYSLLVHEKEKTLMAYLNSFLDVVVRATEQYKPHFICSYLYDLAKEFSRFYESVSVKKETNIPLKAARLALVEATGLIIRQGLDLLGISTVERM